MKLVPTFYEQEGVQHKQDRFVEHLEHASRIVSTWPVWKRNILRNAGESARNESRNISTLKEPTPMKLIYTEPKDLYAYRSFDAMLLGQCFEAGGEIFMKVSNGEVVLALGEGRLRHMYRVQHDGDLKLVVPELHWSYAIPD